MDLDLPELGKGRLPSPKMACLRLSAVWLTEITDRRYTHSIVIVAMVGQRAEMARARCELTRFPNSPRRNETNDWYSGTSSWVNVMHV